MAADALLECARKVATSMTTLQKKFGAVPFSQSAVSIDIADMEKLLVAELPVSLKCKKTFSECPDEVFRCSDQFIIVQGAEPNRSTANRRCLEPTLFGVPPISSYSEAEVGSPSSYSAFFSFSFYGPGGVCTCHRPMYLASFAT